MEALNGLAGGSGLAGVNQDEVTIVKVGSYPAHTLCPPSRLPFLCPRSPLPCRCSHAARPRHCTCAHSAYTSHSRVLSGNSLPWYVVVQVRLEAIEAQISIVDPNATEPFGNSPDALTAHLHNAFEAEQNDVLISPTLLARAFGVDESALEIRLQGSDEEPSGDLMTRCTQIQTETMGMYATSTDTHCATAGATVRASLATTLGPALPPNCNADMTVFDSISSCASITTAFTTFCESLQFCLASPAPPPGAFAPGSGTLENPSGQHLTAGAASDPSNCFGADASLACRLIAPTATADAAYAACFGGGANAPTRPAELVSLRALASGDRVLTATVADGTPFVDRVIFTQHATGTVSAPLLRIEMANGAALTVTADHAIIANGELIAAAHVPVGARLSMASSVVAVTPIPSATVINPITTSGTLLVADATAAATKPVPVLSPTHPIWIAPAMLRASTFPMPLTSTLSTLTPAALQAFYTHAEPALAAAAPTARLAAEAVPTAAAFGGMLLADLLFSLVFAAYALAVPLGVAGVAMLVGGTKGRAARV